MEEELEYPQEKEVSEPFQNEAPPIVEAVAEMAEEATGDVEDVEEAKAAEEVIETAQQEEGDTIQQGRVDKN